MYRLLLLFIFLSQPLFGASPDSLFQSFQQQLTVTQAIETALANASEIKIALLNVAKANKDVVNAWAEVFPTVSTNMAYQRNMEVPVSFLPAEFIGGAPGTLVPIRFGTDNNWQAGLSVNQTLFRGEALVGISSAAVYKLVQEESQRATAQKTVTRTRAAYYGLLLTMEQYSVQRDNVIRLEKNLSDNQKRKNAGFIDEYDVLRLEVELKNERPLLIQSLNAVEEAFRVLNQTMGVPTELRYNVKGDLLSFSLVQGDNERNVELQKISVLTPFSADALDANTNWKEKRGDLRVLSAAEQLKDREIFAYKTRFLPELKASYNYQWTAVEPGAPNFSAIMSPNDQRARSKVLGVTASVTLFNGLRRVTVVQKAQIEKKELLEQKIQATRFAESEIARTTDQVLESTELLPAFDDAVRTARRGYEIVQSRFNNGFGSQIDVTNALLQLRRAELSRAQAAFNYLTAKANYDLAVGLVPFVDVSTQ